MSCGIVVRWRGAAKRQHGMAWWKGRTESQKMASCVSRALEGLSSGNKTRQKCKHNAKQALTSSMIKAVALHHHCNSNPIMPNYNYDVQTDAPATKPGWVARNLSYEKELLDLETLIRPEYNMVLVPWDGM